jgi:hypothetical protein
MKRRFVTHKLGWFLATTLLAGLGSGPAVAATGGQVRFKVPQPFRVGSHVYDSGVIAIRNESSYNPSTSILRVWVNNECLGMMTAHRSVSEAPPVATEALFHRGSDGRLVMMGFRVDGRPKAMTYRFQEAWQAEALRSAQTDFPSVISPVAARRTASSSASVSTVNTSSD